MTNDLRVVKTGACSSLSGKTKLTYELACGPAADLHVRVCKNTGPLGNDRSKVRDRTDC